MEKKMAITAADVKKLREATSAGMMDCKKALTEVDGNFDAAVDYLRKKGLGAADKKAGRIAAEGIVVTKSNGAQAVVLEVNAETDFVSKNDKFVAFVDGLAAFILDKRPASVEELIGLPFDADLTVGQTLSSLIATIGENMSVRRFQVLEVEGTVAAYVHGAGKIGVLVAVQGVANDALSEIAKGVAMHVAAVNPQFISRDEVTEDIAAREKAVLTDRALASGKPAAIVEKIVAGQMNKFFSENCLLDQEFVMDSDNTVAKAVAAVQSDAKVVAVARFALGEGIEKKQEDFAAEVAAQVAS